MENHFDFYVNQFRRLSYIERFSTSMRIGRNASVAEHSFYCLFLLYLVKEEILGLDIEKLSKYIFFHDAIEAFSGDIPRTFKRFSKDFYQELKKVEEQIVIKLEGTFDIKIKTADLTETEKIVVSFIDMIEALCSSEEQIRLGNKFFVQKGKLIKKDIEKFLFYLEDKELKDKLEKIKTKIVIAYDPEKCSSCDILLDLK